MSSIDREWAIEELKLALETELTFCHPNRIDDIAALQDGDWRSLYLLGCLYYDRMNFSAAIEAWAKSDAIYAYAPTKRNLAQAYFDQAPKPVAARKMLLLVRLGESDRARTRSMHICSSEHSPQGVCTEAFSTLR